MAFSGTAAYRSATNIPAAEAAFHNAYTRHVFARASAVPSLANFETVSGLRNGFNSGFLHDEFYWNHMSAGFNRSNTHRSGSYVAAQISSGAFAADTWVSLAATWDGANVRSYADGVADGVSSGSSPASAGDAQVTLCGSSDYNNSPSSIFASGQAAELALWDVVLSAAEIASLAKGYRATRIRPNNLIFYSPAVRGKQELVAGRTLTLGTGSETITPHPRVFG